MSYAAFSHPEADTWELQTPCTPEEKKAREEFGKKLKRACATPAKPVDPLKAPALFKKLRLSIGGPL